MSINFNISRSDEFSGAVIVLSDGDTHTVADSHPEWEAIRDSLIAGDSDEKALLELINPAQGVASRLSALSERVSYAAGTIYFDGDPLNGALIDHIVRIIEGGEDAKEQGYLPFVNFLEKLHTNPSPLSIEHLYHFIEGNKITILPDGDFLAYKGVRDDGTSVHAGFGIVDGVTFENDHLLNNIGSTVEIPRSKVDADRGVGCSTGLHVGSHAYASSFARRLLTAKVNPRDVVSVPEDCANQKIRVSRYTVLALADGEVRTPTFTPATEDNDWTPDTEADTVTEVPAPVATPTAAPASTDKVSEFKALIGQLIANDPTINLRRFKNKRITAARRAEFEQALNESGFTV